MVQDHDTTHPQQGETPVGRRALFRSGAMLAGAAGITAVGASLLATPAEAANGDALTVGEGNKATSTTGLVLAPISPLSVGGNAPPTLALSNASGPSLYLDPLPADWGGELETGQILNTTRGPLIGVSRGSQTFTTQLLTQQDVWMPLVLSTPFRILDTRSEVGRQQITQPSPLLRDGRLPAHTELTMWIAPSDGDFDIPALQLNLTVVKPKSHGYAVIYGGPERPQTSTVNLTRGRTAANSAFVGTSSGTYDVLTGEGGSTQSHGVIVFKVYTTTPAWIVVDISGAYAAGANAENQGAAMARRQSPVALVQRAFAKLR